MDIVYQNYSKKIIKYFLVFGIIYLSISLIPSTKMNINDILIISMIAAILFAFFDIYFPSVIVKKR